MKIIGRQTHQFYHPSKQLAAASCS